jgi:hypothetical protein
MAGQHGTTRSFSSIIDTYNAIHRLVHGTDGPLYVEKPLKTKYTPYFFKAVREKGYNVSDHTGHQSTGKDIKHAHDETDAEAL